MCKSDVANIRNIAEKITPPGGVLLDTLAQLGTSTQNDDFSPLQKCTKASDKKTLVKRARRKYLTNNLVLKLVDAAKHSENSELENKYWNAWHCARELHLSLIHI